MVGMGVMGGKSIRGISDTGIHRTWMKFDGRWEWKGHNSMWS